MPDDSNSEIIELLHLTPSEELHGHFRVDMRERGVLALVGWVLGAQSRVIQVEVRSRGDVIAGAPPSLVRPDIAEAFADRPDARSCGFEILIEPQGSGESHLILEARLEDGTATPLGELRVSTPRRRWTEFFRPS